MAARSRLVDHLHHWASASPDKIALSEGDTEWNYRELSAAVSAGATRLKGLGLVAGGRVAIAGLNSAAWVIGFLSVLHAGGVVVPLNNRIGSTQFAGLLEQVAPTLLVADKATRDAYQLAECRSGPLSTVSELEDFAKLAHRNAPSIAVYRDGADAALISFTSGTTGAPKGAVISHDALCTSAEAFGPYLRLEPGDRTTTLVPLFHNTGYVDQLAHMLTVGGSLDVLPEFHTSVAVKTLQRRPAQYLATVPSILRLLMLSPAADDVFARCRVVTFGGAPMPPAWSQEMARRWPHLRLLHGYGLTEFTSPTHILPAEDLLTRGESVGPPLPEVQCQIWDEQDQPVAVGTTGHVVVAGPMRMDGYWRRPDETAGKLNGRWLKTGDLGHISSDEYLTIDGRDTQVINRGGEKIHPGHLENVLSRLPSVAECAVVSGPHPVLQERVLAAVNPRPGLEFDEMEARSLLADEVPDYAIPESFVVREELPHNASGKVDRKKVRDDVLRALALTDAAAGPDAADHDPLNSTSTTMEADR